MPAQKTENSTYLGAYVFGENAREQLRRAEAALELWAEQLSISIGLVEDVLKGLSAPPPSEGEETADRDVRARSR